MRSSEGAHKLRQDQELHLVEMEEGDEKAFFRLPPE
jgi:hypothetical protein